MYDIKSISYGYYEKKLQRMSVSLHAYNINLYEKSCIATNNCFVCQTNNVS